MRRDEPDNWDSQPRLGRLLWPFVVLCMAVCIFAAALGLIAAVIWGGGGT